VIEVGSSRLVCGRPAAGHHWIPVGFAVIALALSGCGSPPATASLSFEAASSPPASSAAPSPPGSPRGNGSPFPIGSLGPGASGTTGLAWTNCTAPFECATLTVPIDYAHPANGSIELALIRLPATNPADRIGDLVTNPGGPGGSGVQFVREAAETIFSAQLRARFDIIGFDPRGVGQSHPIKCVDAATMDRLNELDPVPDLPAERTALIEGAKTFDAGCTANSGPLLPFMTTIDAARDVEQIRIALGDPKLTYLGFSYGTFLGSTYANLYPDRVRALVLDGAVDATLSFAAGVEAQAQGFADAFSRFLADCASRPACPFYNGGRPGPAYDALMARIHAAPLPAISLGDSRPVGPGEALTGVVAALYDQTAWPILARGLALAQGGDGSLLLELADSLNERGPDGTYTNIAAANTAVNCADFTAPTDLATYDALARKLGVLIPRFGEAAVYLSLDCAFWPFHPSHEPVVPAARGAPPILVVGTTGDPATPYAWAVKLAQELSSGVLLTRTGEGHTAYGKSACIDGLVDAYLLTFAVPNAGTVCS
jgi:pimeloyl-ACP methyl ester carboxylesterase